MRDMAVSPAADEGLEAGGLLAILAGPAAKANLPGTVSTRPGLAAWLEFLCST
jgi:hypothetical protein